MLVMLRRNESGEQIHADKWRVCGELASGGGYVAAFETRDEALAWMNGPREGLDVAGGLLIHPNGYTTPPKPRLPIVGESQSEFFARSLRDDWNFGAWLTSRRNIDRYWALVECLDHHADPSSQTIADCDALLAERPCECDDEPCDTYDEHFELGYGYRLADVREQFLEARAAWLRIQFKKERMRCPESFGHRCHAVLQPITPWPRAPGVYFVGDGRRIKIGKANSVASRLRELQCSASHPLTLFAVAPGGLSEEAAFHSEFKRFRAVGEWFEPSPELMARVAQIRAIGGAL